MLDINTSGHKIEVDITKLTKSVGHLFLRWTQTFGHFVRGHNKNGHNNALSCTAVKSIVIIVFQCCIPTRL